MITHPHGQTIEIRKTDPHRHKYSCAMAEFLDVSDFDADEETGDCSIVGWYLRRFGKRLLYSNDQGMVWVEEWETEEKAEADFEDQDNYWIAMMDEMEGGADKEAELQTYMDQLEAEWKAMPLGFRICRNLSNLLDIASIWLEGKARYFEERAS